MTTQWPINAVSTDADLQAPMTGLLQSLNLLETPEDAATGTSVRGGTPWSLQVVTSGASAASKVTGTAIAALGGAGAVWAGLKAFWLSSDGNLRLAYTGATAVIVAATVIALALVVRGDVQARAMATAAEYQARAAIANEFMTTTTAVSGSRYLVKVTGRAGWWPVRSFDPDSSSGIAIVTADDRVRPKEVEGLVQVQVSQPSSP